MFNSKFYFATCLAIIAFGLGAQGGEPIEVHWKSVPEYVGILPLGSNSYWVRTDGSPKPKTGRSSVKVDDMDDTCVGLFCKDGVVGVSRKFEDSAVKMYSRASWEWKVDLTGTKLHHEDQPIHVVFIVDTPPQPPKKKKENQRFYAALSVSWTTHPSDPLTAYESGEMAGTILYITPIQPKNLDRKTTGWQSASCDLTTELSKHKVFPQGAKIQGIAVFADTNDSESESKAWIRKLTLSE